MRAVAQPSPSAKSAASAGPGAAPLRRASETEAFGKLGGMLRPPLLLFAIIMPIAGLLSPWVPLTHLLIWVAACILISGAELALVLRLHRHKRQARSSYLFLALRCLLNVVMCSFGLWAWVPGEIMNNLLIVTVLLFINGLGLTSYPPSTKLTIWACTPTTLMLFGVLWFGGLDFPAEITMVVTIYLALFFWVAVQIHDGKSSVKELQHANAALQASLAKAQAALVHVKLQSETLERERRELLAGLGQDIRMPVRAILPAAEALKEADDRQVDPGDLHAAALTLSDLAADIADLERVAAGTLPFQSRRFDLCALLGAVAQSFGERVRDAQIRLDVSIFSDLPHLFADENLVRRMAANLLSHALRETPQGGHITLGAFQMSDGGLALRVSTSGAGIAEEELEQILESLMAGRAETMLAEKRASLGLAVVKMLAELHGANLSIRSRLGLGSQATVHFPAERVVPQRGLVRVIEAA